MSVQNIIKDNQKIILFDRVCNLCSAWVSFVYRRDAKAAFKFTSVQSKTGQIILQWCGLPTDHYETMVYIDNGIIHVKSSAFLEIIKHLNKFWPLLTIGRFVPTLLRDWLYDRIALNRYRLFGKKDSCMIPSGDLAGRFL